MRLKKTFGITVLGALTWFTLFYQVTLGQLIVIPETMERIVPLYAQNADGSLQKTVMVIEGTNQFFVDMEVLNADPGLLEALKLSSTQTAEFESFRLKYRDSFLNRTMSGANPTDAELRDFGKWIEGLRSELDEILSDRQVADLQACYRRFLIRSFGLPMVVNHGWLRKQVSLDPQQLKTFIEIIADRQQRLEALNKNKRELNEKEILGILNIEQKRLFDELCGEVFAELKPPLEMIIYQNQLHETDERVLEIRKSPSSILLQSRSFELLPSGVLTPWPVAWQGAGDASLGFLRDSTVSRRLELGESQQTEIEELAEWYKEERWRIRHTEFPRLYEVKVHTNLTLEEKLHEGKVRREAEKKFENDFLELFDKEASKRVGEILIPQQHRHFEDVLLNVELRSLGLPNALIFGNLGARLKVSERQRVRLEVIRDKLTKLLQSDLLAFEEELFSALEQELEPPQVEAWKHLIGKTLEGAHAAPSFLFMHEEFGTPRMRRR